MKKIKICVFTFILGIIMTFNFAHAQNGDPDDLPEVDYGVHAPPFGRQGTTSWQFLKIPATARTAAMGGVLSSISHGDANSIFLNPASTGDVENLDFAFTRGNWIADISYNSAAIVKNFGGWGIIGLNLIYVDYGTMYRTMNISEEIDGIRTGRTLQFLDEGEFSGGDLAFGISYARNITDRLQLGGTVRYLNETLDDGEGIGSNTWSIDIGTVYYTGVRSLRISMIGKNFGPDAEVAEFDEFIGYTPAKMRLPFLFAFGAAMDFFESSDNPHFLTLAMDYRHPNDAPERANVGAEYSFNDFFHLRGGYQINYDERGMTFGAGLDWATGKTMYKLDYAYVDFGLLNSVHMFSFGFGMK